MIGPVFCSITVNPFVDAASVEVVDTTVNVFAFNEYPLAVTVSVAAIFPTTSNTSAGFPNP